MKERFIENGIEYVKSGDYYISNLTVPDDKVHNIGKYGRMHAKFIKENRPCFYSMKMIDGTWLAYLEEFDTTAKEEDDENYFDDDTPTKTIKKSTTDPDSGFMHRNGKPQGFFYLDHRKDTFVTP